MTPIKRSFTINLQQSKFLDQKVLCSLDYKDSEKPPDDPGAAYRHAGEVFATISCAIAQLCYNTGQDPMTILAQMTLRTIDAFDSISMNGHLSANKN